MEGVGLGIQISGIGADVRWVCQNNLGDLDDVRAIEMACKDQGDDFVPLKVIPFSDELPDVPVGLRVLINGKNNALCAER